MSEDLKKHELTDEYLSKISAGFMSEDDCTSAFLYLLAIKGVNSNNSITTEAINKMHARGQEMRASGQIYSFEDFKQDCAGILSEYGLRDPS